MSTIALVSALVVLALAQAQDNCSLSRESGDASCGEAGGTRFYFDHVTKQCQPFYYKGCNGNANRFNSRPDCMNQCSNAKASNGTQNKRPLCKGGNVAANNRDGPISCDKCPAGYTCEDGLCCGGKDACLLDYDAGHFPISGSHVPMFFYSKQFNNCLLFTYYGTEGNANNFPSYNDCKKFCEGA